MASADRLSPPSNAVNAQRIQHNSAVFCLVRLRMLSHIIGLLHRQHAARPTLITSSNNALRPHPALPREMAPTGYARI